MRGKVSNCQVEKQGIRFTPAHAGKSAGHNYGSVPAWVHPRTCGEKIVKYQREKGRKGSPPHMRGKVGFCTIAPERLRFTPAHAGKSLLFYGLLWCS